MNRLPPSVGRRNASRDLLTGATPIAIGVPFNIGDAQTEGIPPTAGLDAVVLPTVAWVIPTSSRQLVASPDASMTDGLEHRSEVPRRRIRSRKSVCGDGFGLHRHPPRARTRLLPIAPWPLIVLILATLIVGITRAGLAGVAVPPAVPCRPARQRQPCPYSAGSNGSNSCRRRSA